MIEAVYEPGPLPLEALRERLMARVVERRLEKEKTLLRRETADYILRSTMKDDSLAVLGVEPVAFRDILKRVESPFPSGWES